ncbi:integral membrane protein [Streptomyces viridochromogenes]|uniref:Integral membrane protein n=1 Tax=Streptomyces viridochromogenes TaxID=1938 RepID=A0A0J7Z8U9_STRVR|nr:integral membrane protein [Streptomyces viridochromogenes]KMS72566.1 integral membrane protein [Streptomyces viridochromogenes]KOG19582.1 integral membrane protein [Streptomyces viridochromogenes]KOG23061.1 integral membrane protein [Streptomyces viridochromogenes]
MQGHGYTQPVKQPPPTGWLVFLRVFFVVLSVLSFGLLMWTMMLRLAIVTRKALDWSLFAASIVVEFGGLILMGMEPGDEIHTPGGWTGLALVLGGIVAAIAYYLSADIRHFHQLRFPGYGAQQPPVGAPAYGYPQPGSPYSTGTVPQATPLPRTAIPHAPIPNTPAPRDAASHSPVPPPPQRPAPARIDQVRAELDELSDYLRQHDGRHDGNREGGR